MIRWLHDKLGDASLPFFGTFWLCFFIAAVIGTYRLVTLGMDDTPCECRCVKP